MLSATSAFMRAGARRAVRLSTTSTTAAPGSSRCAVGLTYNLSNAIVGQQRRGYAVTTNPNPPLGIKNASNDRPSRIGLIGARGYTGQALISLLDQHPFMDLRLVSSRELVGQELQGYSKRKIIYSALTPEGVAQLDSEIDCWVMALPNGITHSYIEAIDQVQKDSGHKNVIVDLSADYRFDQSSTWVYGLPELTKRSAICEASRISLTGCFACGSQIALHPLIEHVDPSSKPTIMGISGWSGAGTKPSPKNDTVLLKDNVMPYSLVGHIHEREISKHLGTPVNFIPHVSSWFRGIHLTINVPLNKVMESREIRQIYQDRYAGEKLIKIVGELPLVKDISGRHHVEVGGFSVDSTGKRVVIIATICNLGKGAATQCLQNMNLALGYAEYEGILDV